MRGLRIIQNGRAIVSIDTPFLCLHYFATKKTMHLNENFPALLVEDFQIHYFVVFDLKSLQDAAEQLHSPKLSGESL